MLIMRILKFSQVALMTKIKRGYKVLNLVESQESIFPVQNLEYAPEVHGLQ